MICHKMAQPATKGAIISHKSGTTQPPTSNHFPRQYQLVRTFQRVGQTIDVWGQKMMCAQSQHYGCCYFLFE
jgi:hypothetical protein